MRYIRCYISPRQFVRINKGFILYTTILYLRGICKAYRLLPGVCHAITFFWAYR